MRLSPIIRVEPGVTFLAGMYVSSLCALWRLETMGAEPQSPGPGKVTREDASEGPPVPASNLLTISINRT